MWIALGNITGAKEFPDLESVASMYPHLVEPFAMEYERWLNVDTGSQLLLVGFYDNLDGPLRFTPFTVLLHLSPTGGWTPVTQVIDPLLYGHDRQRFINESIYAVAKYAVPKIGTLLGLPAAESL